MSREPKQDDRIVFFIARHGYAAAVALVFVAIQTASTRMKQLAVVAQRIAEIAGSTR